MSSHNWKSQKLPGLARRLVDSCRDGRAANLVEGVDLPPRGEIHDLLDRLMAILRPGYDNGHAVELGALEYTIGRALVLAHDDLARHIARAFRYECRLHACPTCPAVESAGDVAADFLEQLPRLRELLKEDVAAAFERDPAAPDFDTVLLGYPGVEAVATYRLARELALRAVPIIPRLWAGRAHGRTGIEINPGAKIGPRFFIDHGTGVVIGETCEIGANVTLYQGVTLGAFSPVKGQALRGVKRHPTLEDDVVVYAGSTILGGETVIGRGAVIGGNVWLTHSVAPGARVFLEPHGVVVKEG